MARSIDKWNALTPTYRRRLESKGITEQFYLSGAPLKRARGHAFTPERPSEAAKHPDRFPKYVAARTVDVDRLVRRVLYWATEAFETHWGLPIESTDEEIRAAGAIRKLDVTAIEENIRNASPEIQLRMNRVRDWEEWRSLADEQPKRRGKRNPFWYH